MLRLILSILLFSIALSSYASDSATGGVCPMTFSADQVNQSKPNVPISGLVTEGPMKGQTLPALLEKGKTIKQLKVGDVLIVHGEVHKIVGIKIVGGSYILNLKRTGISGPSSNSPYTDYSPASGSK